MRKLAVVSAILALLVGCSCCKTKKNDTAIADDNLDQLTAKLIRFDKELFSIPVGEMGEAIPGLENRYGEFFTLYCAGILDIGDPQEEGFSEMIADFVSNPTVRQAYAAVDSVFSDVTQINADLEEGFAAYVKHFKGSFAPKVFAYVSGFNQSLMLTDSTLGVSLDMFLGRNCAFYPQLGIARYKVKNMYPDRIAPELLKVWAMGDFPFNDVNATLLDNMLYQGKLLYMVKELLPKVADTVAMGYTADELGWCEQNEGEMWMMLVENRMLFEKSVSMVSRMMGDAPFTSELTRESPGRVTHWVGYRIVSSYMKSTGASLAELMAEENAQLILEKSKYNPLK